MKVTEQASNYDGLEHWQVFDLLTAINREDQLVAFAVQKTIPVLTEMVEVIADRLLAGGRLYYIGAGSSGRLAVVDASEMPPTFGVDPSLVQAVIAGGSKAMTSAVEFAEDNETQGWEDLVNVGVDNSCFVLGVSASGSAPYVAGALRKCRETGIATGALACNTGSLIGSIAEHKLEVVTGPEFITGSTRMKAGTAQKMVLNMISTTVMIRLGRVEGNRMVDMQLTNQKLVDRGAAMVAQAANLTADEARQVLLKEGSVRKAINTLRTKK